MADNLSIQQKTAGDLREGLTFLVQQSLLHAAGDPANRKRFEVIPEKILSNGDIIIDTNLAAEGLPGTLRLTISRDGEIFRGGTISKQAVAHATMDFTGVPGTAAEANAAIKGFAEAQQEMLPGFDRLELTSAGTDVMAVLADIARQAVFKDMASSSEKTFTEPQRAVADSIKVTALEMKMTDDAAQELSEGFKFLAGLSGGTLRVNSNRIKDTGDLSIRINRGSQEILARAIVSANGTITFSRTGGTLKETDSAAALTEVARYLAHAGHITLPDGELPKADTPAQQKLLDTVNTALMEKAESRKAAVETIAFFNNLIGQTNRMFRPEDLPTNDGTIAIKTNIISSEKGPVFLTFTPEGEMYSNTVPPIATANDNGDKPSQEIEVLQDIGRRLILVNMLTAPLPENDDAGWVGMLVADGTRQAADAIKATQEKAQPLLKAIEFLVEQSEGKLAYHPLGRQAGQNNLQFKLTSPFFVRTITFGETGSLVVFTNKRGFTSTTNPYDMDLDIPGLLTKLASEAVLEGLIPAAEKKRTVSSFSDLFAEEASSVPDSWRLAPSAEETLVLDTIYRTEEQKYEMQVTADILREELNKLKKDLAGYFEYTDMIHPETGHAVFTINPGPANKEPLIITVQPAGEMKMGYAGATQTANNKTETEDADVPERKYSVWRAADVDMFLAEPRGEAAAKKNLLQAKRPGGGYQL